MFEIGDSHNLVIFSFFFCDSFALNSHHSQLLTSVGITVMQYIECITYWTGYTGINQNIL